MLCSRSADCWSARVDTKTLDRHCLGLEVKLLNPKILASKRYAFSCSRLVVSSPTLARSHQDILRLIEQYLSEEGFLATKLVLHDEANLKTKERGERQTQSKNLKRAIIGASSSV
jgi:hypothetical protein